MAIKYKELVASIMDSNAMFNDLKKAINAELTAVLQYLGGYGSCKTEYIKNEFDEHAKDEFRHAKMFYDILNDLGGSYDLTLQCLNLNNECTFKPPFGIGINRIDDNIKSEECAIVTYERLLKKYEWSKEHAAMIQEIIDDEKEHRDDLFELRKKKKKEMIENN